MSYILDALKKSAQKKRNESLPDLLTVQEIVREAPKKRTLLPYLVLGVLLLNASVLLWWLRPWHPEPIPLSAPMETRTIGQTVMVSPPAAQESTDRDRTGREQGKEVRENSPVIPPAESPVHRQTALPPPSQQLEASVHSPIPELASPPPGQKVLTVNELPPGVRQSLPELTISAFLYSGTPSSRMVRINDRMMREGQEISAGLKLDEITADSVIFSYQGYRFTIKVL